MGELRALWRLTMFSVCSPVFSKHANLTRMVTGYLSQNNVYRVVSYFFCFSYWVHLRGI